MAAPRDQVVLEVEGRRRLGPHDERRAGGERLPRHRDVLLGDRVAQRRIPLVVLRDVALEHRDADRRRRSRAGANPPDARSPRGRTPRRAPPRPRGYAIAARRRAAAPARPRRAHEREQRRQSVDADDAGDLRDRQHRDLAVAEQRPGKAVPDVLPSQLGRHPGRRGQRERGAAAHAAPAARDDHGERPRGRATGRRPAARGERPRSSVDSPPKVVIVSTSQYSVPQK